MSERVLDGPCVFCGYNGERYWQDGTHDKNCPIGAFVGRSDRSLVVREVVSRLAAHMKELLQVQAERNALSVQLYAWHSAFGTTQLTHARARLESTEAALDASEKAAKMYAARTLAAEERQKIAEAERDRLKGELEEAEEALDELARKILRGRVSDFDRFPRRTIVFAESYVSEMRDRPAVRRALERGGRG